MSRSHSSKFTGTREVVQTLASKYARGRALDVGGGTSKYREIIRSYVSEYLVSDLYETDNVDFVEDARKLSHPNESFETIFSFQLLEHVDDTHAVIREMYRVLKKGGHAILTAPFLASQHGSPSDYHRFTMEGLKWYVEKAGFEVVELGKQGGSLGVLAEVLRFSLLHPYKRYGRLRRGIMRRIINILRTLDRGGWLKNPDIYANVYVVAKK